MTTPRRLISFYILFCVTAVNGDNTKRSFIIDHQRKEFLKDDQPFRFISGEMHYFRVPKAYWKDRLNKIKMAGLNVVAFYIEWSSHEPEPGEYFFDDNYDLEAFLKEIKDQGLLAIARPGPYICAERDNGGLPYWLRREHPKMAYRSNDKDYLAAVDRWFGKLLPILARHLYKNGGTIIAVQVENEYGHFFMCDKDYMEHLLSVMEKHMGKDVVYFRADFPDLKLYKCDKVRDILVAGDISTNLYLDDAFFDMSLANPKPAPKLVIEYYTGWMDYWGWSHNFKKRAEVLKMFERMIGLNASVSFYMFVGGTNFGFKAGSSIRTPLTTSYDYGAPVAEHGDIRPIYHDIRDLASKYLGRVPEGPVPGNESKLNLGTVQLTDHVSLEDVMDHFREKNWLNRRESERPESFDWMSQNGGFMMYRTKVDVPVAGVASVRTPMFLDRAYLRAGGKLYKFYGHELSQGEKMLEHRVPLKMGDNLTILVENTGRETYGLGLGFRKGLLRVLLNGIPLFNWTMEAVPITKSRDVDELLKIVRRKGDGSVPGFFHGTFTLPANQTPLDTFLDVPGWRKGVAFINGVNLGRYWPLAGPQVTLYVPAPYLRPHPEENRLMLFETEEAPTSRTVSLVDKPLLDANITHPEY